MGPGRHKLPFHEDGCCPPPHTVALSPPFLSLFSGARACFSGGRGGTFGGQCPIKFGPVGAGWLRTVGASFP
jgi:hypothetical protein